MKFRVFATDSQYPEGKMYSPEENEMFGQAFMLDQSGRLHVATADESEGLPAKYSIQDAHKVFDTYEVLFASEAKDKHGEKIYHGDIIHLEDDRLYVARHVKGGFYLYDLSDMLFAILNNQLQSGQIIGNVLENPEALER